MGLVTARKLEHQGYSIYFYNPGYSFDNQDKYIGILTLDVRPDGKAHATAFIATDFCVTSAHISAFIAECKKIGITELMQPERGFRHGLLRRFIKQINERL